MDPDLSGFEPASTPNGEVIRLRHIGQPKHALIERDRIALSPLRHGQLDMFDSVDVHAQVNTEVVETAYRSPRRISLAGTSALWGQGPAP